MTYQTRVYIDGRLQKPMKIKPHTLPAKKVLPVKTDVKVGKRKPKPYPLFDHLIESGVCKTDSDIARLLESTPNYICRIRNRHEEFGPKLMLMLYDKAGMTIEQIRIFLKANDVDS